VSGESFPTAEAATDCRAGQRAEPAAADSRLEFPSYLRIAGPPDVAIVAVMIPAPEAFIAE
jgi:hypothetical protein